MASRPGCQAALIYRSSPTRVRMRLDWDEDEVIYLRTGVRCLGVGLLLHAYVRGRDIDRVPRLFIAQRIWEGDCASRCERDVRDTWKWTLVKPVEAEI